MSFDDKRKKEAYKTFGAFLIYILYLYDTRKNTRERDVKYMRCRIMRNSFEGNTAYVRKMKKPLTFFSLYESELER